MKPVNFSDVDIANIVEAVIKDDPDAIMIKDSLAKSLSQLREGRYVPISEVSQVRQKTGLSQSQFAKSLGISVNTLKSWEQGQRKPSGSAQVLLKLLGKKPELIDEIAHLA
nr:type II toxin-antitoxin system MqsA family antitoxin [Moraxella osloensis]